MKFIATLSMLLCISGQILAREDRLSEDCLNGTADRDKCCAGVPDAWYAHLRNPEDCGSFYQCEHEKATWKACPAGLHWSIAADRCEWPHLAGCEAGATQGPSTNEPTQKPTEKPSSTSAPPTTSDGNNGGENPQLPEGCYDGSIDAVTCCEGISAWYVHLPDPNNCGKFFHCDNGKAVHKDCPAGLHWSVKEDKCDWPEAAGCEGKPTTQQPTTQKPTTHKPTTQEPTTSRPTTQQPTTSRPTTQQPTTSRPTTQQPTTSRPTTQQPTTQRPTTQQPTTQRPTTQQPTTQRPTTQQPTTQRPTTEQPSTTTAPPTTPAPPTEDECAPEPVCHQCLSGVFPADLCCRDVETYHKLHLANGNDCSSHYTCVDGLAVAHQCPEGLHWSIDSDRCEWPVDAKCEANGGGNGNEGGNNGGEGGNNGGEGGNDGVSNDCLHGKVDAKTCCQHVPFWVDVLLQNNDDCHTFIQCVHGAPMVRPCPAGLWWSVTANRCEWKDNATCTW